MMYTKEKRPHYRIAYTFSGTELVHVAASLYLDLDVKLKDLSIVEPCIQGSRYMWTLS